MAHDMEFARNLTRDNMLRYYIEYDLLWLDEAFDQAWSGRENWIILRSDARLGFCSLSRDAKAVYIRELQVQEQYRGQGAGAWVIEAVVARTCELRRSALRLTVFKNNPAQALYRRSGFVVVGDDDCFLMMQREAGRS
ncbi:GNAT family N-acetyltransferase [Pseudomonas sp. SZMC_28357]|uniref:GNAT family N-acetyltransferase n=1 Tax=Pseudomonas sp. SZMC_28357 TaxID=3074380 RepID=UPI0028721479|nr:GNAT family N-acetyltransferase [Pseudomonas sp. SZMC_28357]MDR9752535.1 GNAT family N-acetyltransferase [Pseudomonas sp. SZMC_28357]